MSLGEGRIQEPSRPSRRESRQDRVASEGEEVWAALEAGGRVYVCGDGRRMAPAVREEFMALHGKNTGTDDEAATAWLAALTETGHYVEDVWAS